MTGHHNPCDKCGDLTEPFCHLANRHYCRACAEKVVGIGVQSISHPLIEAVRIGFLRGLMTSLWSGLLTTAIVAGMITTIFAAFGVFALLSNAPIQVNIVLRFGVNVVYMAGFSFSLVGILGFPLTLILGWVMRPRQIAIDKDAFLVTTAFSTIRLPFDECLWTTPQIAVDSSGCYLPGQRLIVIRFIDPQKQSCFACGFTDETFRAWETFAKLQEIPFMKLTPTFCWIWWLGIGAVLGGIIGMASGAITSVIIGNRTWFTALSFLGFLDGSMWGLHRLNIATMHPTTYLKSRSGSQGAAFFAIVLPLVGFVVGMKVGILCGGAAAIITGVANAIVCGLLEWNFSVAVKKRLESEEVLAFEKKVGDTFHS